MEITTEENRISIDGVSYPKGGFYVKPIPKGVALVDMSKSWSIKILVDDTTIDGSPVADRDELMTFFNEQGFKSGGTSPGPEVVTWDDVQDKPLKELTTPLSDSEGLVPLYTQSGQLPVGTPEFPENAVPLVLLDSRLSAAQRSAIDALVSPTEDYADMAEATVAIKSIIDALKAT